MTEIRNRRISRFHNLTWNCCQAFFLSTKTHLIYHDFKGMSCSTAPSLAKTMQEWTGWAREEGWKFRLVRYHLKVLVQRRWWIGCSNLRTNQSFRVIKDCSIMCAGQVSHFERTEITHKKRVVSRDCGGKGGVRVAWAAAQRRYFLSAAILSPRYTAKPAAARAPATRMTCADK